jgi:hypothetical protein
VEKAVLLQQRQTDKIDQMEKKNCSEKLARCHVKRLGLLEQIDGEKRLYLQQLFSFRLITIMETAKEKMRMEIE